MIFNTEKSSLNILKKYALKYKSDKINHGYLEQYNKHFYKDRFKKKNILEIGIKRKTSQSPGASSLKMWKKYFPNSTINGIDIDSINRNYREDNINIYIGDQSDEYFLKSVIKDIGRLDIIIDDGSHINELTLKSYNYLFQHLNQGGIYVIEDLLVSYMNLEEHDVIEKSKESEKSEDGIYGTWWGMHLIKDISLKNDRNDINNFILSKIYDLDLWQDKQSALKRERINNSFLNRKMDEIDEINFYKWIMFIHKAKNKIS